LRNYKTCGKKRNLGFAKDLFFASKIQLTEKFRLISRNAKRTAELYEKRIFPSFVFNEKNLENPKFELNIGMAKRAEKYCGMKSKRIKALKPNTV